MPQAHPQDNLVPRCPKKNPLQPCGHPLTTDCQSLFNHTSLNPTSFHLIVYDFIRLERSNADIFAAEFENAFRSVRGVDFQQLKNEIRALPLECSPCKGPCIDRTYLDCMEEKNYGKHIGKKSEYISWCVPVTELHELDEKHHLLNLLATGHPNVIQEQRTALSRSFAGSRVIRWSSN